MRDGVVQVARELLALEQAHLVELARPRPARQRNATPRVRRDRDRDAADDVAERRGRDTNVRTFPASRSAPPTSIARPEPHRTTAYTRIRK